MKSEVIYRFLTHPLFVFPLFAVMLFASNGWGPLVDEDEAAYALMATEMVETGDWITQQGLFTDIHKKPPLHIWLTAISIKIFGNNEFAIRFFTSLFGLGTLILIYFYGKRYYHERVAISAAIMTGTCFIFPVFAKIAFVDSSLLFCSTWAAFSLMGVMQSQKFIHVITFWLAASLGILFKGPPILIFLGIFSFGTLLLHPGRLRIFRLHPWFFLPLALFPLFYWGYIYWQKDNGETISWMLDWYIFDRAKGGTVLGQTGPPGYFFLVFAAAFLPFFRYFLPGIWEGIRSLFLKRKNPELLMLGIWLVSGWVIYEFIPSKLPSYAMASIPALALLLAHEMISLSEGRVYSTGLKALTIVELGLTLGLCGMAYLFGHEFLGKDINLYLVATLALLPIGTTTSFIQQLRKKFTLSNYFHLIFVGIFWLTLSLIVYPKIGTYWEGNKKLAIYVNDNIQGDTLRLEFIPNRQPSLPYYIKTESDKSMKFEWSWWMSMNNYPKEKPWAILLKQTSIDTIKDFIPNPRIDTFNVKVLGREDNSLDYYLMVNKAAEKK